MHANSEVVLLLPCDTASPDDEALATAREAVIRPLADAGLIPVAIAAEGAKALGFSVGLLYKNLVCLRQYP